MPLQDPNEIARLRRYRDADEEPGYNEEEEPADDEEPRGDRYEWGDR